MWFSVQSAWCTSVRSSDMNGRDECGLTAVTPALAYRQTGRQIHRLAGQPVSLTWQDPGSLRDPISKYEEEKLLRKSWAPDFHACIDTRMHSTRMGTCTHQDWSCRIMLNLSKFLNHQTVGLVTAPFQVPIQIMHKDSSFFMPAQTIFWVGFYNIQFTKHEGYLIILMCTSVAWHIFRRLWQLA